MLVDGLRKHSTFDMSWGLSTFDRPRLGSLLRKWAKTTPSIVACGDVMELIHLVRTVSATHDQCSSHDTEFRYHLSLHCETSL